MEFIREDCIYARQSVDRKDSISIESQIDFCKYELKGGSCRVFKDKGYSGKNTDRPESVSYTHLLAAAPKMAQKNRGPYSGTSVSLAFLMPSAVASITTSSFSFMEFRSTSICFLQELDLAPPSA